LDAAAHAGDEVEPRLAERRHAGIVRSVPLDAREETGGGARRVQPEIGDAAAVEVVLARAALIVPCQRRGRGAAPWVPAWTRDLARRDRGAASARALAIEDEVDVAGYDGRVSERRPHARRHREALHVEDPRDLRRDRRPVER